MVGKCAGFQEVVNVVQLVAPADATVLIQGETGTRGQGISTSMPKPASA
jgi:transcriptional regulator with GAF, ATPase, and Fis domain